MIKKKVALALVADKGKPLPDNTETRERTLLEAARMFGHLGYAATTLRMIAKAANIKAGSIYYHFESKEQILDEVLDKGIKLVTDLVREKVDSLPANATARDRVAAAIEGHLWGMLHYSDFSSTSIGIYGQIPTAAKNRHRMARRAYANYWDQLLEDALKRGELRMEDNTPTAVIRLYILGALNSTVEWYNPQKGAFQAFVKQLTSFIFDGTFRTQ